MIHVFALLALAASASAAATPQETTFLLPLALDPVPVVINIPSKPAQLPSSLQQSLTLLAPSLRSSSLPLQALSDQSLPAQSPPGQSLPVPSLPASSLPAPSLPASSLPASSLPASSLPAPTLPAPSQAASSPPASSLPVASLSAPQDNLQVHQIPAPSSPALGTTSEDCNRDITKEFTTSLYDFGTRLFKASNVEYESHFVLSHYSVWLSLAAMAEGAAEPARGPMLQALGLPLARCLRLKYYALAQRIATSGRDVQINSQRLLALDDSLKLNDTWAETVRAAGLLDVGFAPLHGDAPRALRQLSETLGTPLAADLSGNSVLLDSFDFEGSWETPLPEAAIERDEPFFNDTGARIGSVDYIKIKKKAKLAFLPTLNAKAIDLPLGVGGRFRFLMLINQDDKPISNSVDLISSSIIPEIFGKIKESVVPLEITFPRFTFSMVHERLRPLLEAAGLWSLWREPAASAFVSDPPALPSALLQRVSVSLGLTRLRPLRDENASTLSFGSVGQLMMDLSAGIASALGRNFVANRPFLFAVVDAETHNCLFYGAYSKPT